VTAAEGQELSVTAARGWAPEMSGLVAEGAARGARASVTRDAMCRATISGTSAVVISASGSWLIRALEGVTWRSPYPVGAPGLADGAGRGGSVEHRLGHEVVSEYPRLPGLGIEAVTENGRERVDERRADGLVVGGADSVADVAGA
jgi:hypothetical protein